MKKIEAHICSNDGRARPWSILLCSLCTDRDKSMDVLLTKEEISEYNSKIEKMKAFEKWKESL